jgi:predicted alpha-1,6-mannanase (GH76 family)
MFCDVSFHFIFCRYDATLITTTPDDSTNNKGQKEQVSDTNHSSNSMENTFRLLVWEIQTNHQSVTVVIAQEFLE